MTIIKLEKAEMKKISKLFPLAVAAVAFVGCNNYDYDVLTSNEAVADEDHIIVQIANGSEIATRGGYAEAEFDRGGGVMATLRKYAWIPGDQIKIYDKINWRADIYKFDKENAETVADNSDVFEYDKAASGRDEKIKESDRAYAVYPYKNADGSEVAKFTNEGRTELAFTLPSEYVISDLTPGTVDVTYGGVTNSGNLYTCPTPMWGTSKDGKVLTFNYLTAVLRIEMMGMKVSDEVQTITISADEPLAGAYTVAEFDPEDYATVPALVPAEGNDDNTTIELKVKAKAADNVIFVPIPAGKYTNFKVVYMIDEEEVELATTAETDENGKTEFICAKTYKATKELPTEETVESLVELNELLEKLAGYERDVTADITLGANIAVLPSTVGDYVLQDRENETKLIIPQLQHNVTLNIIAGNYKFVTSEEQTATMLPIEDASDVTGGTNKLTLSGISTDLAVVIKTKQGIVLGGELSAAVTVENAGTLELAGKFSDEVIVKSAADVVLGGEFAKDLTVGDETNAITNITVKDITGELKNVKLVATNEVEFAGTIGQNIDVKAETITISGTVSQTGTTLKAVGAITVEDGGSLLQTGTQNIEGNITVKEGGKIRNASVKAGYAFVAEEGATIANNITTTGGTVTLNGQTVNELKVNGYVAGEKAISLTNATVKKISSSNYTATAETKTKVYSKGASVINEVTEDALENLTFTSEVANDDAAVTLTATDGTVNIYTGAQLMALNKVTGAKNVNIHTDVTGADLNWTSLTIYNNVSEAVVFDGKGHTISTLKVNNTASSATRDGFFSQFYGSGSVTVKDLTVKFSTINGGSRIGALVGHARTSATIEKVAVEAKSITGTTWIGGLIGATSGGTITITDSKVNVTEKLAGQHSVGGLIGMIYGGTAVTVAVNTVDNTVTVAKFECVGTPSKDNAGKFGMLVGFINEGTSKLTATAAEGKKLYTANTIKADELHFDVNKKTVTQYGGPATVCYVGQEGNYVGYSKNYNTNGNVTILGTAYTTSEYATEKGLNVYQLCNHE